MGNFGFRVTFLLTLALYLVFFLTNDFNCLTMFISLFKFMEFETMLCMYTFR